MRGRPEADESQSSRQGGRDTRLRTKDSAQDFPPSDANDKAHQDRCPDPTSSSHCIAEHQTVCECMHHTLESNISDGGFNVTLSERHGGGMLLFADKSV